MPAKNLYKPKEKEKSIYSSSGAANRSNTAATGTRSAPQNNVWNAEQSTPRSQSNPVQKIKREKSPSELGEEVVRSMLEDFAKEERQKRAAEDRAAQYDSSTAKAKAAAGKQKTAQYGNAAGQFGEQASYSSPAAAKPAVGKQKSTPYGGAATVQYNRPAAAKPAVQKHEKTPSELGDEMVARVLVEEGLMDSKDLEEYLASFEKPSAKTFTTGAGRSDIIGADAYAARNAAPGNGFSVAAGSAGEDVGPTQAIPDWLSLMFTSNSDYPGLTAAANQVGLGLKESAEQFTPDKANQLASDWLDLMSMSNSDYPGVPAAANQLGFELKDKIEQFTPDKANQFASDWLDLMSMSGSDYPGLPAAANQFGFELKDKIEQFTPDKANQFASDWLDLMSMSNSDYPGVPAAANQAGFWLKDKNEQLRKDTHLAPGALVEDYLRDSFKSGAWSGLENMRNGMVDLALIGTNADLEQQRQQAQQLAFLGGRYQHHADSVSDVVQSVREELPEAAESFRSHEAAEYARKLDEMYEADGYYRLGGAIASKIGKMAPDLVMKLLAGGDVELIHTVEMGPLYISAAGRAAAEARAGGADEETAQLYGMLSGSIEVAAKGFGDFFFGEKRLNDWLKGMVQSKTIRTALVNLTRTLGNDLKTFVTKIAEEYFARMWNDDERDFLQVAGETGADVIYQKLVGTLANAILNASPNTMPNTTQ